MRSLIAFTKKELIEQVRTFKILIMLSVFFLFGMMSPLLAKAMPDILSGVTGEGITIIVPDPTKLDAYAQFFKNATQMGIIVLLLVFGGVLSNELSKGTLINILSKGLPRHTVILSKYLAALILWTASYVISVFTCYGYTLYMFESAAVDNLWFALFCFWVFGAFVIALIFLSSTIAGGNFGGLVLTAIILGGLLIGNIFPQIAEYNPVSLMLNNMELLIGTKKVSDLMAVVWITIALSFGSLLLSIIMFRKKKL